LKPKKYIKKKAKKYWVSYGWKRFIPLNRRHNRHLSTKALTKFGSDSGPEVASTFDTLLQSPRQVDNKTNEKV
jgi:hypothetical protein